MNLLVLFLILVTLFLVPSSAYAAQLDAAIIHDEDITEPSFKFLRVVYIEYPEGGEIADLLRGKSRSISITADSQTPGMDSLISQLNQNLRDSSSSAIVIDAKIIYHALLNGNDDSAAIEYKVELIPTLTNHILQKYSDKSTIDANWRGITLDQPMKLDTVYGQFDINNPKDALDILMPQVMTKLEATDHEILVLPLIDASKILELPLHKWHSLFDNTAIIAGSKEYNFSGKYVVTHYSMGECNLEVGDFCKDREWSQDFEIDRKYSITAIESQDDATIAIEGYVDYSSIDGIDTFETDLDSPVSYRPDTDEFPATVMYGMAGIAAIGGIAMFVMSNRKLKRDQNQGQTGIDPANLRAYETSDSAGGYKTNRGETYFVPSESKSKMPLSK